MDLHGLASILRKQIDCSSTAEGIEGLRRKHQALIEASVGLEKTNFLLESEDEILAKAPHFTREQIKVPEPTSNSPANIERRSPGQGWKGLFCGDGGWLAAAKAINAIGQFLRSQGVQFGFGRYVDEFYSTRSTQITDRRSSGAFKQPLFTDGTKTTCNGVETVDGTRYYADKVVLAAGAWSPTLIDLEDQCVSKVSPSNTCQRQQLPR